MRSEKQKPTGKTKESAKRPQKELESRRQPKAAPGKQRQAKASSNPPPVRRQDEKSGHTLH